MRPYRNAEAIKAFIDGREVEARSIGSYGSWITAEFIDFINPNLEFRIVEPEKVEVWQWLVKDNSANPMYRVSAFFYRDADAAHRSIDGAMHTAVRRLDYTRIEVTK